MKIALYGKAFNPDHLEFFKLLIGRLEESGCKLLIWKPFYDFIHDKITFHPKAEVFSHHEQLPGKADYLLSIGGDGTMLDAIQLVRDSGIPIAGINLGRMGFLSSISRNEIIPAISDILEGRLRIEKRSLISIESPSDLFGDMSFALNELSINKKEMSSMVVVQVWINEQFLNSYWSDGLIVATPTGSTAYSMSCNGPIIAPESQNFVITPIAPHNLTVRPIVIPDSSRIRIKIDGRDKHALIRLDSRVCVFERETEIVIRKADFEVNLLQRNTENFFSTLRGKLNWGMDIRN
ncbi:MAG: NAD kinase [Bacteroidetes bacterium]|nr:NAD kinase [Bacteroidota bacterium]